MTGGWFTIGGKIYNMTAFTETNIVKFSLTLNTKLGHEKIQLLNTQQGLLLLGQAQERCSLS